MTESNFFCFRDDALIIETYSNLQSKPNCHYVNTSNTDNSQTLQTHFIHLQVSTAPYWLQFTHSDENLKTLNGPDRHIIYVITCCF